MAAMSRAVLIGILAFMMGNVAYGRGQTPPPPPFSGGNAGDWLGSGPVFGFEDGGGPGGGWGGWWWGGGGTQGGWGSGAGGNGYGPGGGQGTGGLGNTFDPPPDRKGSHGNCWQETEPGGYYRCACFSRYDANNPPASGADLPGTCNKYDELYGPGCTFIGQNCKGTMP